VKARCHDCGETVGNRSSFYCDYHRGLHSGRQGIAMRRKRAKSPAYRKDERRKVKKRMARIRAARVAKGLNTRGGVQRQN
jgi:hypothetical protein